MREDRLWILQALSGLACLPMLILSWSHHLSLSTYFDLAIFDQALWLIAHGHEPFVTVRGLHILGNHFSPLLYALAPLYWMCHDVLGLLFFQVAVLMAGAFPLYKLARARLKEPYLAWAVTVAYLANPQLQRMAVADFEPGLMATPLLLWALWIHQRGGRWGYYLCLLLALGCKQNVGLAVAGLGLSLGANRRGMATTLLGVLGVVLGNWVVSAFNDGQPSCHLALYENLTPALLGQDDRPLYFLKLLYPLAFLPLLCPGRLFPALPVALLNIVSWKGRLSSAYFHYDAAIIPFLLWATVGALERLPASRRAAALLAGTALVSGMSVMGGFALRTGCWPSPRDGWVLAQLRQHIPPEVSVTAQSQLLPQLSHRVQIWMFPNPMRAVCWGNSFDSIRQMEGRLPPAPLGPHGPDFVVLLGDHSRWPLSDVAYDAALRQLLRDPAYQRLVGHDGLVILRKKP